MQGNNNKIATARRIEKLFATIKKNERFSAHFFHQTPIKAAPMTPAVLTFQGS
jgi:hypothetical protein